MPGDTKKPKLKAFQDKFQDKNSAEDYYIYTQGATTYRKSSSGKIYNKPLNKIKYTFKANLKYIYQDVVWRGTKYYC